jgi:hypothetical protein
VSLASAISRRNFAELLTESNVRGRVVKALVSTAGCGKPHVRWCGRVTGRNEVNPWSETRS